MTHPPPSHPPARGGAATSPPAELDRRFTAFAVDRAVAWGTAAGVAYAVWRLAGPDRAWVAVVTFLGVLLLLGVVTAVLLGTTGLTPGKALAGLRVVRRSDGRPIGFLPALGRTLVLGAAGLPTLGLGAATLAWTAAMDPAGRRRGLHDRIGDAVVVDVRPVPEDAPVEQDRPRQVVNLTAMRLLPAPPPQDLTPPEPTPEPTPQPTATPPPPSPPTRVPAPPRPQPPPVPPAPAQPPPPAPPPPAPPPSAALPPHDRTRLRGGAPDGQSRRWRVEFDTGEAFVVEGLALVGRRPEARAGEPVRHLVPLRSTDMSLSKTHAQFQVAPDGALVVMDRGSTNGSSVVRRGLTKPLTPGRPSTLVHDDLVRFGDRTMRVVREG